MPNLKSKFFNRKNQIDFYMNFLRRVDGEVMDFIA